NQFSVLGPRRQDRAGTDGVIFHEPFQDPSYRVVVSTLPFGWRPFMREAELTKHLLAAGLGSLVKANHMETGLFSHAFFNLSVGLERLLKLIYIIDHVGQQGDVPTDETMRKKFSHDLEKLHAEAMTIKARLAADDHSFKWAQPDPELTLRVIRVLAEFARTARYYNLDYL